MKKHFLKSGYLIVLVVIALFSCKKNGTGGKAEIAAFPEHHGRAIKGCTVYVKFNATDLPTDPTKNYDLVVQGDPNEDHVHLEELRYGKYYLYAVGFDSSIAQIVKGGVPVKIKYSQRKEELDIKVPVTE